MSSKFAKLSNINQMKNALCNLIAGSLRSNGCSIPPGRVLDVSASNCLSSMKRAGSSFERSDGIWWNSGRYEKPLVEVCRKSIVKLAICRRGYHCCVDLKCQVGTSIDEHLTEKRPAGDIQQAENVRFSFWNESLIEKTEKKEGPSPVKGFNTRPVTLLNFEKMRNMYLITSVLNCSQLKAGLELLERTSSNYEKTPENNLRVIYTHMVLLQRFDAPFYVANDAFSKYQKYILDQKKAFAYTDSSVSGGDSQEGSVLYCYFDGTPINLLVDLFSYTSFIAFWVVEWLSTVIKEGVVFDPPILVRTWIQLFTSFSGHIVKHPFVSDSSREEDLCKKMLFLYLELERRPCTLIGDYKYECVQYRPSSEKETEVINQVSNDLFNYGMTMLNNLVFTMRPNSSSMTVSQIRPKATGQNCETEREASVESDDGTNLMSRLREEKSTDRLLHGYPLFTSPNMTRSMLTILTCCGKEKDHVYKALVSRFVEFAHAASPVYVRRDILQTVPCIMAQGHVEEGKRILKALNQIPPQENSSVWEVQACRYLSRKTCPKLIFVYVSHLLEVNEHVSIPSLLDILIQAGESNHDWNIIVEWWEKNLKSWKHSNSRDLATRRHPDFYTFWRFLEHIQMLPTSRSHQLIIQTMELFRFRAAQTGRVSIPKKGNKGSQFEKAFEVLERSSSCDYLSFRTYCYLLALSVRLDCFEPTIEAFKQGIGNHWGDIDLSALANYLVTQVSKMPNMSYTQRSYKQFIEWILSLRSSRSDHNKKRVRISYANFYFMLNMASYGGDPRLCADILLAIDEEYQLRCHQRLPFSSLWCLPFIRVYVLSGRLEDAYSLLKFMKYCTPLGDRLAAWACAFKTAISQKDYLSSLKILVDVSQRRIDRAVKPWCEAYSSLITLLLDIGEIDLALKVYLLMTKAGFELRDVALAKSLMQNGCERYLTSKESNPPSPLVRNLAAKLRDLIPRLDAVPAAAEKEPNIVNKVKGKLAKQNAHLRFLYSLEDRKPRHERSRV